MWILSWNKYYYSKLATFISIVGALMRYAGVTFLISGIFSGALICFGIGIGFHYLAEYVAKSKQPKSSGSAPAPAAAQKAASAPQPVSHTVSSSQKSAQPTLRPTIESTPAEIRCSNCGTYVSAKSAFCNNCGNNMNAKTNRVRKCLRCGEVIENGSNFCGQCGYQAKTY